MVVGLLRISFEETRTGGKKIRVGDAGQVKVLEVN